jgi:uncharacterized NAD(P)/FAD-binding protein YdhS
VAILGSGLTAVDTVLSLAHEPRSAPITLISRRGLAPQAHARQPAPPAKLDELVEQALASPAGVDPLALLRSLRKAAKSSIAAGGDWRSVVDGLRPHTARLWQHMPHAQRRRFLARLRPFWEVHRHRMAPNVAEQFDALRRQGLVRLLTGHVAMTRVEADQVWLYVRERGDERLRELAVAWVINCTGPSAANSEESNPAVGSLLVKGWVRPDALSLGLEATSDGRAIAADGAELDDLWIIGTLRKPRLWETTAVPELRSQAEQIASGLWAGVAARQATAVAP